MPRRSPGRDDYIRLGPGRRCVHRGLDRYGSPEPLCARPAAWLCKHWSPLTALGVALCEEHKVYLQRYLFGGGAPEGQFVRLD